MTPQNTNLPYRLELVEKQQDTDHRTLGEVKDKVRDHDLEIHGERGIYAAIRELTNQLKWVQRALWGLAASVTVAAFVFALGTIGHH